MFSHQGADGKSARARQKARRAFLVAMRPGETPVPIPNTMVKPWEADGTALGTAWESRWPPDLKREEGEAGASAGWRAGRPHGAFRNRRAYSSAG